MKKTLSICIIILLMSCTTEKILLPEQLVDVQVDLQYGFAGHSVFVYFNDEIYFTAFLNEATPLSGPEASFDTILIRGLNIFSLYLIKHGNYQETLRDTTDIFLGDAEAYKLVVTVINDTMNVVINDVPFP